MSSGSSMIPARTPQLTAGRLTVFEEDILDAGSLREAEKVEEKVAGGDSDDGEKAAVEDMPLSTRIPSQTGPVRQNPGRMTATGPTVGRIAGIPGKRLTGRSLTAPPTQ